MNLREVDSSRQRKQSGVDVCGGLVLLAAPVSFLGQAGRRYLTPSIEFTEHTFQLCVAVGNLRLVGIVEFDRLAQREEVLRSEVSCERLADYLLRGATPTIPKLGQSRWVLCPCHNRPDDIHSCRSGDIADDMMKLKVHLHQRFFACVGH